MPRAEAPPRAELAARAEAVGAAARDAPTDAERPPLDSTTTSTSLGSSSSLSSLRLGGALGGSAVGASAAAPRWSRSKGSRSAMVTPPLAALPSSCAMSISGKPAVRKASAAASSFVSRRRL